MAPLRTGRILAALALAGCTAPGPAPAPPPAIAPLVEPAATATASAQALVARLARVRTLPVLEAAGEVAVAGGTIAVLAQVVEGIPVWDGELRVFVRPGGVLHAIRGVAVEATAHGPAVFAGDEAGAIARAAGGVPVRLGRALRRWYPTGGTLVAAWVVEYYSDAGAYRAILDGADGRELARVDLTADAAFSYRVWADTTGERHPFDGPTADPSPNAGVPTGMVPPFVPPALVSVESLNHPPGGAVDPWLPAGAAETAGNNIDAYTDAHAPNGLSAGDFRASTTAPGTFDRTYNVAADPLGTQAQQMAAITSLFYTLNWLHDLWYDAGFVETTHNAQLSNYGRGGTEGDRILAEAQDNAIGGSRNNANMATPSDGMSPRMQVFLWTGPDDRTVALQPSGKTPKAGSADFGAGNFDITAQVVLGIDGAGTDPNDACSALTNAVAGKIVLVDRGTCSFASKALVVQNAGGIGMLVANNVAGGNAPHMPADPMVTTPLTIGALSIAQADGDDLKAALAAGAVTATLHRVRGIELDGAIDATVIGHEFGHYVHHRLSSCDTTMCGAMSEGWGDFSALLMMSRAGDDPAGAYTIGAYATNGFSADAAYFGIRRAPYSTNLAINGLSFRHMGDDAALPTGQPFLTIGANSEVHNAGEVWAQTLWDAYQAVLARAPSFDEGRSRMMRYVVAGLLMTPPSATPTETRDALLAVIGAADQGDHDAVAAAFARRGMGSCAVSPPRGSQNFAGIVESTEVSGIPVVGAPALAAAMTCDGDAVLDSGETARLSVPITNTGPVALAQVTVAATTQTPGLALATPEVTVGPIEPGATAMATFDVSYQGTGEPAVGDVALAVTAPGACATVGPTSASFRLDVDDIPGSLATDTFDAEDSLWTASADDAWLHERETALDGLWHGVASANVTDTSLASPLLTAAADAPLVVTFTTRHEFEASLSGNFDGGVIEVSTDGGTNWRDVTELAAFTYPGTLDLGGTNPLAGRAAFVARNPAFPLTDTVTLDFGMALAGRDFRLRFRIGTDANVGTLGWEIDDVAFTGIVGTPFAAQAPNAACNGEPPPPGDDGGCCEAGPVRAGNVLCGLGVLALLARRRRKDVSNKRPEDGSFTRRALRSPACPSDRACTKVAAIAAQCS